jgi:hypothetical protein
MSAGQFAPVFLSLPLHGQVLWILTLDPVPRRYGEPRRFDTMPFKPELATVAKYDIARF